MKLEINQEILDLPDDTFASWREMIAWLLHNHIPGDHGITEFMRDGQDISEVLSDPDGFPFQPTGHFKIGTQNRQQISIQAFDKVFALLKAIQPALRDTANLFREGHLAQGSSDMVALMNAIRTLIDFTQTVATAFGVSAEETDQVPEWTQLLSSMTRVQSHLEELIAAQSRKDLVAIADILEYELTDAFLPWPDDLRALQGSLNARTC